MEFQSDAELRQFIEISLMLKYYQAKGVPVPDEVAELIRDNDDGSDVFAALNNMIQ